MKIIGLHAENVMRVRAVDISPDASTVVVGGRNAQGKSSVLKAIEIALGGKDAAPRAPVRNGEVEANVVLDLGDIIVKRRIGSDGKSTLAVETREGAAFKSPQTMLDRLVGQLSFDPLAFSRMKPGDAADVLCKLVGLDLTSFHTRRQSHYDERTAVNRVVKSLEHAAQAMPQHDDAPESIVDVADVGAELERAHKLRDEAEAADRTARDRAGSVAKAQVVIQSLQRDIAQLQERLDAQTASLPDLIKAEAETAASAEDLKRSVPDIASIQARYREIDALNTKVRQNLARAAKVREVEVERGKSAALTAQIEKIDADKIAAIAAATFPIPGLSIDDEGVTLNGIPFEQSSSAEQLRASVAVGIAMNPKLRVLLVRDGSLLDDDGMRLLAELAAEHDAQVWVERVAANPQGCTVFIEDGSVVEANRTAINDNGAETVSP